MYNIYVFKHNYAYIKEQELGSPLDIQMPLTLYYSFFFFFTYFLILWIKYCVLLVIFNRYRLQ